MQWHDTFEKFDLLKDYTLLSIIQPLDYRTGKDFKGHLSTGQLLVNLDHNLGLVKQEAYRYIYLKFNLL